MNAIVRLEYILIVIRAQHALFMNDMQLKIFHFTH